MKYFTIILLAVITTHATGQVVLFNKTYANPQGSNSAAVIERYDGKYLIAGTTQNPNGLNSDINLLLVDSVGNLIWDKVVEKPNTHESAISLLETSDNNYLVSGEIWPTNFPYLLLIDGDGNLIGDNQYASENPGNGGYSVQEAEDGSFFFVEPSVSSSSNQLILNTTLYNVAITGEINWTKDFASVNSWSVIQTLDNGYALTGMVNDSTYNQYMLQNDIILIKTNPIGDTLWTQKYKYDRFATAYSLLQTPDAGYLIAGFHDDLSFENRYQGSYLIKTDEVGDTLWTKSYGELGEPRHIVACAYSSGYIMSSYREVQTGDFGGPDSVFMHITKLDTDGNIQWSREFDGDLSLGNNVTETSDGGFLLTGTSFISPMPYNIVLIKLDSIGEFVVSTKLLDGEKSSHISVYPNPASEVVTFKLSANDKGIQEISIFNITGQKIKELSTQAINEVQVGINELSNGMYFYEVTSSDKERFSGKFVVDK